MIVQFGTSRFLQAHVDMFASEAAEAGQEVPPIVVVQTTGDATRAGRLAAFGSADGYPVVVRGIGRDGDVIDRTETVRSVVSGLSVQRDWTALTSLFEERAGWIVSNTGDRGYEVDPADRTSEVLTGDGPPRSFPAMLLSLLHRRWCANGGPITMLPCELVVRNGAALKATVLHLARTIGAEPSFLAWLAGECIWVDTLVDRIVSEPIEPVGAVAEPYALWAVERQPRLVMPFSHPAIVLTDDLDSQERLKLHILNLGHSWLAQRWLDTGAPVGMTVRESLADPETRRALDRLYRDEVVPGFAHRGMLDDAVDYVATTIARFSNPFLDHRLADIAAHHDIKLTKRVGGFLDWVETATGAAPPMPVLSMLVGRR